MDATAPAAQSARAFPSLEGPAVDILESSADKTTTPQTESQEENAVNPQKSDRLTEPSIRDIFKFNNQLETIAKLIEAKAKIAAEAAEIVRDCKLKA